MPRLERVVDASGQGAHRFLAPRQDLVVERPCGDGRFELERGPFASYLRTIERKGECLVETIDYQLAPAVWSPLLGPLVRRALASRERRDRPPWWAPPDPPDAAAATTLGVLCALAVATGYLGTLLTQTITFAAQEFGADRAAQGGTLAAVRIGVLGALVLAALADRRGRRRYLIGALAAATLVTAASAAAPSLAALGAAQVVVRGLVTASAVLVSIVAAEEMAAGSRAYALSLVVMAGGLGVGACLLALPLADLGTQAWRILYLLPLGFLPVMLILGRHLAESRRFRISVGLRPTPIAARRAGARSVGLKRSLGSRFRASVGLRPTPIAARRATLRGHGRRFWLLAASAFLLNLFFAPAAQFLNEFLRVERSFSAAGISLFAIVTNAPGALGVVVGGRLADVHGRRVVGAVGVLGGVGATVAMFYLAGWPMWAASVAAAVVGAATIPALGVYGPELFPTALRGRANGLIALTGVAGSSIGLLAAGNLADAWGQFAPAMALLSLGAVVMVVLVLTAYPETARRELEELNPDDRPPR